MADVSKRHGVGKDQSGRSKSDGESGEHGKDHSLKGDRRSSGRGGRGYSNPTGGGVDKGGRGDVGDVLHDKKDRVGSGGRRDRAEGGDDKDRRPGKLSSLRENKSSHCESRSIKKDAEMKKEVKESDEKKSEEDLKAQEEEERHRQEEELKRKEEEEKKQAAEEAERLKHEEEKCLREFISDAEERNKAKKEARTVNLSASENRPDESFFTKLDSSLKKNTAFIRKVKNLTESQKDSLSKELMGLNLTKYIGEVAGAIIEAKLKMSDVPCAVHICSLLHQRYTEFSQTLIEVFNKFMLSKKDEKIGNASKYRVDLRFLGELIAYGVFTAKEGLPILANQLSILVNSDREEHAYLPIITSFCKHCGDDYTGIVPRKYRLLSVKFSLDVPKSQLLPTDRQKGCRNLLKDYFTSLIKHVTATHRDLKAHEKQNRKIMQTKGEVSTERREAHEAAFNTFQKLSSSAAILADLLDEDFPEFHHEDGGEEGKGALDIFNPLKDAEFQYEGDKTLFEDEDTRSFYETLPDLRAFIPGILYRDSENINAKDDLKNADTGLEEEMEQLAVDDIEKELETERIEESMKEAERQEVGESAAEPEEERFVLPEAEDDDTETGTLMRAQFESFLASLPNCVNRDIIDKSAVEFCMNFNTKSNRKKLVKGLFSVHRTRYDLLPFYSRMVAILEPCMPELASDLVNMLKSDFKWHVRKKDQINIESKMKIVRFIGELVKFKVCPKIEALQCLKMLMFDFRHHNIEMACALLETCGRFLYRSPDSHYRTKIYLEVMMRKKHAMKLESRYETMIENAFYYSNPPEIQVAPRKERPPMHEYIRKLLYKDLSKVTVEKVLRQMRKLKWDDPEIAFYATKCLTAVWNIRYNSVHCAANLLAGIAPFHEHVAIQVVDGVLEDIRLGMEVNHPKYNQRRVSCVKYLGELYNYRMVESSVIFRILYSLITFGVSLDEKVVSPLDPPDHLFRIRLICVTLETCGQYFDKGSSKKKLDCFLVYFQRYYWFKRSHPLFSEETRFPIDIENLMKETLEVVRPKMVQLKSYQEACDAAEQLEAEYRAKIANVLSLIETEEEEGNASEEDEEEEEDGLSTIAEGEENDEDLTLSGGATEGSGTQDSETSLSGHEVEEEAESSTSDEEDYVDSDVEEAEVKVTKQISVPCKEDEDFMTALDTMMNETMQARTQESLKVPQLDIALPTQLKSKVKRGVPIGLTNTSFTEKGIEDEEKGENGLKFVLMTRRGNKQHLTNFEIPVTAEFATKFKEREEAERVEKEKMKQMVLNFHERQEEEEYQDLMAQSIQWGIVLPFNNMINRNKSRARQTLASMTKSPPANINRERKVKYQHPKGAPDADLIFGNKKR